MENLSIKNFRDIIRNLKEITSLHDNLVERIRFLTRERGRLNIEMLSLNRELYRFGNSKYRSELVIQDLKNRKVLLRSTLSDLNKVIKEYDNQQQETLDEKNRVWDKQCELWEILKPSFPMSSSGTNSHKIT